MPAAATASEPAAPARAWFARPRSGGTLLLAALLVLAPLVLPNNYAYEVAIQIALNAIVCVGLNLLIGYAGQISLGHAGFFALGGYASAILATRYGVPVWLSLPAACAGVGALAYVLGRPTLRLKGHPLAMATLGLGVIISIALTTEDHWTGGPDGMQVPPLVLLGLQMQGEHLWYGIAGALLVGTVWLALNLIDSPNGRALRALHGSEVAAKTLGIDCARFKLQVFTLSAVLAALAGALTAHYAGFITPAKASFLHSVELVIMVVFGGMASVFGAVLVATMVLFPQGLVPTLARRWGGRIQ